MLCAPAQMNYSLAYADFLSRDLARSMSYPAQHDRTDGRAAYICLCGTFGFEFESWLPYTAACTGIRKLISCRGLLQMLLFEGLMEFFLYGE